MNPARYATLARRARASVRVVLAAAAVAVLSSCLVESEYPIHEPDVGAVDADLLGEWMMAADDVKGPSGRILFLSSGGAMLVLVFGPDKEFEESYEAYASEYGGAGWLDIRRPVFVDGRHEPGASEGTWLIAWYQVRGSSLAIRLLDLEAVSDAIRCGELAGTPSDGGLATATLTGPTADIRRFIEAHPGLEFLSEGAIELER